jgi:hypothetical protein
MLAKCDWEAMMFCNQCGTEMAIGALHCIKCSQPPSSAKKKRWYPGRRNAIGLAVLFVGLVTGFAFIALAMLIAGIYG